MTFNATNSIINNSQITIEGTPGGSSAQTPTGSSAFFYVYGADYTVQNIIWNINSGPGSSPYDGDNYGNAGGIIVYEVVDNMRWKNVTYNISTGPSRPGSSANDISVYYYYSNYSNLEDSIVKIRGTDGTVAGGVLTGPNGHHVFFYLNNTNFKSSSINVTPGAGGLGDPGPSTGVGGSSNWTITGNNSFINTNISSEGAYGNSVGGHVYFLDYGNSVYINVSLTAFTGSEGEECYYYLFDSDLSSFRNTDIDFVCKPSYMYLNSTELNFYDDVLIDLDNATSIFRIYADKALFWNFTVDNSSTMDSDFNNLSTSPKVGLRGGNTFGAGWTWNNPSSIDNQTYDEYFLKIIDVSFTKKSSDSGSYLYNYTNFTCSIKAYFDDDDLENYIYANITFLKDGA